MVILVAEDEAAIREVEVAYLKNAGYDAVEAKNGREALDQLTRSHADLAVLDIDMPLIDGLEVCRQIRETSMMPIIMVTAKDGDDDELRGFKAGADDYVKKPYNPNVLVARVQGLLHRHSNNRIVHGSLEIEPTTMIVRAQGKLVALTTTQFNLLLTLASQPGVVLSRAQLIDAVYNDPAGHDIYDRTIDAHIKSIRKAIEDDPAVPQYVQTVIGRGYRFGVLG